MYAGIRIKQVYIPRCQKTFDTPSVGGAIVKR